MMKRVHVTITGKVQGVYFRAFVKEAAKELGLKGYVRNIDEGALEFVAEGHELKLKRLVDVCKLGPNGAIIHSYIVRPEPYKGEFKEFKIRA